MSKYRVIRHEGDHHWTVEVLPSEVEALEWAETFREQAPPDVTYTVEEVRQGQ